MSNLILINDEDLIGDSLSIMPAFHALRDRWDGDAYLHMANEAVRALVKPYGFKKLNEFPEGAGKAKVIRTSAMRAFQQYVYTHHMAQAHFGIVGLDIPTNPPVVPLEVEVVPDKEEYDFVIAPWSKSDNLHNKLWFEERWTELFKALYGEYAPWPPRILVVGGYHDEKPSEWHERHNSFARFHYGFSLTSVAGYLLSAKKAVITIDNGISHIARMLGIKNHVLIYPECLPPQWVANPNAYTIRAEPRQLMPATVLRTLEKNGLL